MILLLDILVFVGLINVVFSDENPNNSTSGELTFLFFYAKMYVFRALMPYSILVCSQERDMGTSCDGGDSGKKFYYNERMGIKKTQKFKIEPFKGSTICFAYFNIFHI